MLAIFLETLPFFMLIGLGYGSGRTGFFTPEATAYLSRFVFYFALSAMLIRFSANLSIDELINWPFMGAYLFGSMVVWGLVMVVALIRKASIAEAATESHVSITGNTGFLGIPMLSMLLGAAAIGPIMMILVVDLIFFMTLFVVLVLASRDGRLRLSAFKIVARGLVTNPMILSIITGVLISASGMHIPDPINDFLEILGSAATPGALFAIGASLAVKSAERVYVAGWLTFAKLVLHPAAVAVTAYVVFRIDPYAAMVMVASAALPVAGNVYIIAQHYGAAPARVSASILISTVLSIFTLSAVIALVQF